MKNLLLFFLFICSSNIIKAQDTLSTRYGESILVKVIEVGTAEVKYKKLDNLNGPVFSMLKSDLLMIKYENGTSEDYSKEERALIKVKKRHTVRNIGIVYGVLGVGVSIALISAFRGGFRGGFFGL
jgi:hypothetical protein